MEIIVIKAGRITQVHIVKSQIYYQGLSYLSVYYLFFFFFLKLFSWGGLVS